MVLICFFLLVGSLSLGSSYTSEGPCPSPQHSHPVANFHRLLRNISFYPVAYDVSLPAAPKFELRKEGHKNTYIYTRDPEDHCFLTTSDFLNKSNGYLIEIGIPILGSTQYIFPYLECEEIEKNKTRMWYDSNILFFWWCFQPKAYENFQSLFIFIPTFVKNEISSEVDQKIQNLLINNHTMSIKSIASKYVVKELINKTNFYWGHIIRPCMGKNTNGKPFRLNVTKIIVIIILVTAFGTIYFRTIIKMK